MKKIRTFRTSVVSVLLALTVLAGCAGQQTPIAETPLPPEVQPTQPVATTAPTEEAVQTPPLYVNLTWHQHQPMYYKNAEGVYTRPWVRVHATKDYLDMAETVAAHEGMRATFNITPSLIRQLDDYANNGAKDLYWVLAEVPAAELTTEQKTFILQRFFDANWDHIIAVHPRYKELLDLRAGTDDKAISKALETFTEQDFRDLQIWFNLAWVDPDYLAKAPFKALVDKGQAFAEEDKTILFDGILDLIRQVIPYHKQLQDEGVIEVTTTPYAHPILPLIYNSDLALVGNPKAIMPDETFSYPQDAEYHLVKSVQMYEEHFGRPVRGLWPGEGAVAQDIVNLVSDAGYTFMQTGEPVLAKSLGMEGFKRDGSEKVTEPDLLYRPYYVEGTNGKPVAVFFRDWNISDKIGFTYSGMAGKDAAADLVGRLEAIQADFVSANTTSPHIVTIVVDGENAWENYDNDGKEFLNSLYELLSTSKDLQPITPSEYLKLYPEQNELPDLFPGAWFSANYDTWIGETEEAMAWNLLKQVRVNLEAYENGSKTIDPAALAEAFDYMYLAEGSDWFWWYGTDQDSGQDSYFDEGFRALLKSVYLSLGEEVPSALDVPLITPQPEKPKTAMTGAGSPVVDGVGSDEEWVTAAHYAGKKSDYFRDLHYVMDETNLSMRFQLGEALAAGQSLDIYLGIPGEKRTVQDLSGKFNLASPSTRALQILPGASTLKAFSFDGTRWVEGDSLGQLSFGEEGELELSFPLTLLGELSSGDSVPFVVLAQPAGTAFPAAAPGAIQYMSFGPRTQILLVEDPEGDDKGPGTYTYPTDGVFKPGDFDLTFFQVETDGGTLIFTFGLKAPITNGWGSGNGFSVQTFDVYIDKDPGAGSGDRMLLPGRNAALSAENGWEVAVWVEGWTSQVVIPDPEAANAPINFTEASSAIRVYVDTGRNAVVASVPVEYFGEGDPTTWAYAAVVLGQEGYPAEGVWRVRDVSTQAAQYKFGGAAADNNHTRIIDIALPAGFTPDQATSLGTYASSTKPLEQLTPDDYAIVPLNSATR